MPFTTAKICSDEPDDFPHDYVGLAGQVIETNEAERTVTFKWSKGDKSGTIKAPWDDPRITVRLFPSTIDHDCDPSTLPPVGVVGELWLEKVFVGDHGAKDGIIKVKDPRRGPETDNHMVLPAIVSRLMAKLLIDGSVVDPSQTDPIEREIDLLDPAVAKWSLSSLAPLGGLSSVAFLSEFVGTNLKLSFTESVDQAVERLVARPPVDGRSVEAARKIEEDLALVGRAVAAVANQPGEAAKLLRRLVP